MGTIVRPRHDVLRRSRRPVLLATTAITTALALGIYWLNPRVADVPPRLPGGEDAVELIEIPPALEQRLPPAAAPERPRVPVEMSAGALEPVDIAFESPELYEQPAIPLPTGRRIVARPSGDLMDAAMVERRPVEINMVIPDYPVSARRGHVQGNVVVEMIIDTTGKVESASVVKGPEPLHRAALDAALRMLFVPATRADRPVRVRILRTFTFHLG